MGIESKEEKAVNAAKGLWLKLPQVQARQTQVFEILKAEGWESKLTCDLLTRAMQIDHALDAQNHLPDHVEWMQAQKMWPFDKKRPERGWEWDREAAA